MDRIRTLLLARTNVVVVDPDLVASAATRPARDSDADKLEDELAQLGFVLSLDLATLIRRLPHQTVQELRVWLFDTLAQQVGAQRPRVPLAPPSGESTPYLRRITSWLNTAPDQPCPWCGEIKPVGALDPCGHLVCRTCWSSGSFTGCPICHRRIAPGDPFVDPLRTGGARVTDHGGTLALVHLGVDLFGIARQRFEALLQRAAALSADDRDEIEAVIDTIGPEVVRWLPERIPTKQTMAVAIARLWLISPNRAAIMRETAAHLATANDVLRVAAVLMGGSGDRVLPNRLRSIDRALRRAVLDALEQLPLESVIDEMMRERVAWKRVAERLHPFELADKLPNTTLAFAAVRGTDLSTATFGPAVRARAVQLPFVYVEDDRIKPIAWAGPIEDALRAGNPRSALARLTHRAGNLLRRADHLVRVAQTRQLDALKTVIKAVELAAAKGPAATMLVLSSHVARRGRPWRRRVFFHARGHAVRAWKVVDARPPLRGDAIAVIVGALRRQLVARAEGRRQFPRAVIDRALGDLAIPFGEHPAPPSKLAWPRGTELALPEGQTLRVFVRWEHPPSDPVDRRLSVVLLDDQWRHVATCDASHSAIGDLAAVHRGNRDDSDLADLHFEKLVLLGAKHVVIVVVSGGAGRGERLAQGCVGVMLAPPDPEVFDPSGVAQSFDLRGGARHTVALTIDLAERRLRWLDVPIATRGGVDGFHGALAHIGRDYADLAAVGSRPTMWDLACIHATARANIVYVRERDGTFTMYRRREDETKVARLGRLMSGASDDGKLSSIPTIEAPTWFALITPITVAKGSSGYVLDSRGLAAGTERLSAAELIDELGP